MRVYALYLVVTFLSIRAYRDYFTSLCALIVLTALSTHPDWPNGMLGVPGLNPWNILLLNVLIAWVRERQREGLRWDLPGYVSLLLVGYGAVMLVAFLRLIAEPSHMERFSSGYLYGEYLVNTYKWVVPGLILYDCCRTRERLVRALVTVFLFYGLLALLIMRWMPPWALASGELLERRSLRVLVDGMGWHRVNLSAMLAGVSWAILCATALWKPYRKYLWAAAVLVVYAQALTGGRAGYVAWGAVGFALGALRWRKLLLVVPAIPLVVVTLFPAVAQRALEGIAFQDGRAAVDEKALTASRTMIWPYVMAKIAKRPLIGYGREAMVRSGLTAYLQRALNEEFAHPHNAYLQWLFDNGALGAIPVALFYLYMLIVSVRLLRSADASGLAPAVGGLTFTLLVALLVASMGSQTFYPREGAVPLWASMFLTLRVAQARARQYAGGPARSPLRNLQARPPAQIAARPAAAHGVALRPGQRFAPPRPPAAAPAASASAPPEIPEPSPGSHTRGGRLRSFTPGPRNGWTVRHGGRR